MKSILVLPRIEVENANAISGLTYGFPGISNFLGFTHALSRELTKHNEQLSLGGCAVISHQVQVHQHGQHDKVFSLTRNSLTKDGKTASFNEEARMHMTISLVIECHFSESDANATDNFEEHIRTLIYKKRLAGGTIKNMRLPILKNIPDDERGKFAAKTMRSLLPGYMLIDRNDYLKKHREMNPHLNAFDAFLDFITIKEKANKSFKENEEEIITWKKIPKPFGGWLVPITVGYQAISPLYTNGEVSSSRDMNSPFQFVESVYSIGEWLSPHRVKTFKSFKSIFWRYRYASDWYHCENNYQAEV